MLRVGANNMIQVNGVDIGFDELAERLKRMFAARDDHILFFDADDGAEYGFAVEVLDQAREGGAVTIAPLDAGADAASRPRTVRRSRGSRPRRAGPLARDRADARAVAAGSASQLISLRLPPGPVVHIPVTFGV